MTEAPWTKGIHPPTGGGGDDGGGSSSLFFRSGAGHPRLRILCGKTGGSGGGQEQEDFSWRALAGINMCGLVGCWRDSPDDV